jgi:hypothetical protein
LLPYVQGADTIKLYELAIAATNPIIKMLADISSDVALSSTCLNNKGPETSFNLLGFLKLISHEIISACYT